MQKVFLDANILLEILFRRARYNKTVEVLGNMQDVRFCISVLSADLVMYFVETEKQSKDKAWAFLRHYEILNMIISDAEWAHDNDQGDFEDAMQIACAKRHGCSLIVTLDRRLETMYGKHVPVQTIR